jgi:hypothetical protein
MATSATQHHLNLMWGNILQQRANESEQTQHVSTYDVIL